MGKVLGWHTAVMITLVGVFSHWSISQSLGKELHMVMVMLAYCLTCSYLHLVSSCLSIAFLLGLVSVSWGMGWCSSCHAEGSLCAWVVGQMCTFPGASVVIATLLIAVRLHACLAV